MFNNKNILITGGTGSFGNAFVRHLLNNFNFNKLIIFSRDEMKQWKMSQDLQDPRIRFFLGDVRDRNRLYRAFREIDYVVHAAALKIVPSAEYDPFEVVKTNIFGAMNVIDAAIDNNVSKVVALSTDKACLPVNLYGGTKLISDKLFVSGNSYSAPQSAKFSVVRYGNVMGSRGSVIPLFISQTLNGYITITDERMTRFMVSLDQGVQMVLKAFQDMRGGETYVKKVPSMKVLDVKLAISKDAKVRITGIRPGEKLHEQMISKEDAPFTYEYHDYYKILPAINTIEKNKKLIDGGKAVADDFIYSSDNNSEWMSTEMLKTWLSKNGF
ncbi:UDP-N-acetylglucosamine 4,6-dehydratase (inverting) [Paracoccaceae bacterium]|nr:UDP-N-acetylglucosamine 4,6-dehydratase (inverting) [Paracoccaceae bacterium]